MEITLEIIGSSVVLAYFCGNKVKVCSIHCSNGICSLRTMCSARTAQRQAIIAGETDVGQYSRFFPRASIYSAASRRSIISTKLPTDFIDTEKLIMEKQCKACAV